MKRSAASVAALLLVVLVALLGWSLLAWDPASPEVPARDAVADRDPASAMVPSLSAVERVPDSGPALRSSVGAATTEAAPPQFYNVSVRLVDEAGQPVGDATVWLAPAWHRLDQLPMLAGIFGSATDTAGTARFRVPSGRHFVHVQHDAYVCPLSSPHGNGGNAVLDVPAENHTELRLRSIWVVAYQLDPSAKAISHWVRSTGARAQEWHPSSGSALSRAARILEARFPGSSAEAYAQTSESGVIGDFEIRVVWEGHRPSATPAMPVRLRDFRTPVMVDCSGSQPSPEFGTLFVRLSGHDGRSVDGLRLIARRRNVRGQGRSILASPAFKPVVVSGEACPLPSGTYDLVSESHPFLAAELQKAGPIEVTPFSFVRVPIVLELPLVKVALEISLPEGHTAGTHVGSIRRVSSGQSVTVTAANLDDSRSWDLPVGDYEYELGMYTPTPTRNFLYGKGAFQVAVGVEPVRITIPLDEREVGSIVPAKGK